MPPEQPNSSKKYQVQPQDKEKLPPPHRSRARTDSDEAAANYRSKVAVNLHLFSERLADAAAWRRGELPPDFPFGLCLWLIVAILGTTIAG